MEARKRDEQETTVIRSPGDLTLNLPAKATTPAVIVLEVPPNLIWEMLLKESYQRLES